MSIEEKLRNLIAEHDPKKSDIDFDEEFRKLDFDSLDFVELILAVESEFGIEIHDDDAEHIETPNQFLALVSKIKQEEWQENNARAIDKYNKLVKRTGTFN